MIELPNDDFYGSFESALDVETFATIQPYTQ